MSPAHKLSPLRWIVVVIGALVSLLGLTVMTAWYTHTRAIIQPVPGVAAQQFNTALCFFLSGAALVFAVASRRAVALGCLAVVTAIGVTTFLEYVTGRTLVIDNLFAPRGYFPDAAMGRMAFNAALGFAVLGFLLLGALLAHRQLRWAIVGMGGSMLIALGGLAIIGYAADLPAAYLWHGFTQMAIHTAMEFMALGGALVLLAIDQDLRAGVHAPVWHGVAVSLAAMVLTLGLWYALRVFQISESVRTNQLVAGQLSTQLRMALDSHVRAMRRQSARWRMRVPDRDEWESDAHLYLEGSVIPPSLDWVDPSGLARWRVTNGGDDSTLVTGVARTALKSPDLERARRGNLPLFIGPTPVARGRTGFYVIVPLVNSGRDQGLLIGAFDLSRFLARVPSSVTEKYAIVLAESGRPLLARGEWRPNGLPVAAASIDLGNMQWEFRLLDRRGPNLALSWVFAVMGLLLSGLLGYMTYLGENAQRRTRQLETILDSSPVGMLLVDPWGQITRANEMACRLFGYERDEPVGQLIETLVPMDSRERHVEKRTEFLTEHPGQVGTNLEMEGLRKDGTKLKVDVGISTVLLDRRRSVLAIVRDVTARYEAEQALLRRTDELARSNADLEQFAYVASHDLRAPLRAVDHLSQWLTEELDPHMSEEQRGNGRLLLRRVRRMDRLLSDLLEYARVTHVHRESERVQVAELVDDAVALLDWPPGFTLRVSPGLPAFATNRTALRLVFANLMGNAIKHHDRQAGTVEVDWRDAGPSFHEFTVSDDGPGIAPQYHEKAFEMFQTLRPRDEVEGSGMGLALIKRLIESREGMITIESSSGRGTTFRFTWPKLWKETPAS
jgi:PAS domain S-box-containing protein